MLDDFINFLRVLLTRRDLQHSLGIDISEGTFWCVVVVIIIIILIIRSSTEDKNK